MTDENATPTSSKPSEPCSELSNNAQKIQLLIAEHDRAFLETDTAFYDRDKAFVKRAVAIAERDKAYSNADAARQNHT